MNKNQLIVLICIVVYIVSLFLCRYLHRALLSGMSEAKRLNYDEKEGYRMLVGVYSLIPWINSLILIVLILSCCYIYRWRAWKWFISSDIK